MAKRYAGVIGKSIHVIGPLTAQQDGNMILMIFTTVVTMNANSLVAAFWFGKIT